MVGMAGMGSKLLEMEREIFGDSRLAEERLAEIVGKAEQRINGLDEPADVLGCISNVLRGLGYEPMDCSQNFAESLKSKRLSCRDYTYVYLEVAKKCCLPLHAVLAPGHVFVRWEDGDRKIDWETTAGCESSDEFYKNDLGINEQSIEKGVYLKNLSEEETVAVEQTLWGSIFSLSKRYEKAIWFYDKALELNSGYSLAWYNKGDAYFNLGNPDKAIECYDRTLELDPNDVETWNNKGAVCSSLRLYDKAIECYDRATMLKPDYATAWNNKGMAYEKIGQLGKAKECYRKAGNRC